MPYRQPTGLSWPSAGLGRPRTSAHVLDENLQPGGLGALGGLNEIFQSRIRSRFWQFLGALACLLTRHKFLSCPGIRLDIRPNIRCPNIRCDIPSPNHCA